MQAIKRGLRAAGVVLLAATVFSACTSGTQATSGNKVEDSVFEPEGFEKPAAEGPAAATDKKVLVMSCGQNQETCSVAADAQMAAADAIGWDAKLVDYESNPDTAQSQIRSAIAGKYDGVLTYALDCPLVSEAIRDARKAGLFVLGAEGQDCETNGFDAIVSYTSGDFPTFFEAFGKKQGEVAIAKVGDNARILVLHETDVPNLEFAYNGLVAAIDECDDCEVLDTVEFIGSDFGAKLEQKISQALVKNPNVNMLTIPYDSVLLASAMPALRSSGKLNSIVVAAAEGQSGVLDLVRDGTLNATGVAVAQEWEGWASVDALNRVFAGEEPVSSGIGLMAYDADHNLPESGPVEFPVDFKTAYLDSWGVN